MRVWSSRALVNDIVNANLTQKDLVKYWVSSSILYWLLSIRVVAPSGYIELFPYYLKNGFSAISLLIALFGFIACYRSNGGVSGERLLDKFAALFFVASIRGLVLAWLPFLFISALIYGVIYYPAVEMEAFPKIIFANLAVLVYKFFVYFSVARNLKLIDIRSAV